MSTHNCVVTSVDVIIFKTKGGDAPCPIYNVNVPTFIEDDDYRVDPFSLYTGRIGLFLGNTITPIFNEGGKGIVSEPYDSSQVMIAFRDDEGSISTTFVPKTGGGGSTRVIFNYILRAEDKTFLYYDGLFQSTASSRLVVTKDVTLTTVGEANWNEFTFYIETRATKKKLEESARIFYGKYGPEYGKGDDPYNQGGTSGTGGGGGNFSDQSDEIDFGSTPNISLGSTGLCNAFSPTKAELTELGNYMWGTLNIENYRRIFADPMDVIIGLSAIPISPQLGSKKEVFVGNIGTGLTMSEITRNFVTLACGAISLDEYWGSYLDYSPSTTVEIYLPFIGYHKLDTNEVMGRQVNLLYQVDVITGSCLAQVMTIDREGSRKVIATYQGNCGYQLPISGTNWSSMFGSALGMVGTAAIAIGSGGTALPLVAPALASTALNASKDDITRSGSIGGNPTLGMPKTPYLIITRPNQALPEDQNKYIGYPSFITVSLSELEGYTEFEVIHLEGIPATDEELTELETMLKEGVIF